MGPARLIAAALLLAVVGPGCADRTDTAGRDRTTTTIAAPTTTAAPTSGFVAGMAQYREDEARGVMQVELRNVGEVPLLVRSLDVEWAGLEGVTGEPDYTVHPGVTVALQVAEGRGRCDGDPDPASAVVHVEGTTPDGGARQLDVPVTEHLDVLTRVRDRRCDAQAVTDAVSVGFGGTWTATELGGRPAVTGTIELDRRDRSSATTIEVLRAQGLGVLLRIDPLDGATGVVGRLGPGVQHLSIPVAITSTGRCDAHALADDKRSAEYLVAVRIGSAEHAVTTAIDEASRPTVKDVVRRTCGEPAPG